tara:strand:+ start:7211 stop:9565 length:2355 start_codon:yes stop_codon:yes gene_type:complete
VSSILRRTILVLLLLLAVVVLGAWLALRVSLPPDSGEFTLTGLEREVLVHYDAWQRPYVEAETLGDALHAQGWLHATHRLWQMELLRRAGSGRLAALLGPSLLQTDKDLWRAGVPQLATRLERNASTATLALVDHYLSGVNNAIARFPLLPPEFLLLRAERPRWTRADVFALGALMAFQSANNMHNELLRLALGNVLDEQRFAAFLTEGSESPDYPFALPPRTDPAMIARLADRLAQLDPAHNPKMPRLGFGSNGWVVAAERSQGGQALFAFDSHDKLGLPNLFYENHLFFDGERQLRGWSVPGLPGVINGFNEHLAWGFTNIGDTQDLFLEQRAPNEPMHFRDGDNWYRARAGEVVIEVRGAEDEPLEIVHTRNGPLISDTPPISLAWTVHRLPDASLDSLFALNLVHDWSHLTSALDEFPAPTLNATVADVHGGIGLRTAGVIPRRGVGDGLLPLDGSKASNRWRGTVQPGRMPESRNPPQGFLAAANARVNAPGDGPLVSADNAAPYRIARLQAVLAPPQTLSIDDMRRLQLDRMDAQAQALLPTLLARVDATALDQRSAQALELLRAWAPEPVSAADSAAALIFQKWYMVLAEEVFADELGELWPRLQRRTYPLNHALDHLLLHASDSPWWRGAPGELITRSLQSTVEMLAGELGGPPSNWRLRDRLHVELRHELGGAVPALGWLLNAADAPWGGGPSSVGRARYDFMRPFAVDAAATVRVVAEMTTPPRVAAVIPGGQSGHPLSAHYLDQYPAWLAGELLPVAATPQAAGDVALRLVPE